MRSSESVDNPSQDAVFADRLSRLLSLASFSRPVEIVPGL